MSKQTTERIALINYGQLTQGQVQGSEINQWTLVNQQGTRVAIINYGAIITNIAMADRQGKFANIVLGYDDLLSYELDPYYLGCVIGRYANRIKHGKFMLDGQHFELACNNQQHHLHAGVEGFNKRLWQGKTSQNQTSSTLTLTLVSQAGDQGYPGQLTVSVSYTLDDNNSLTIEYEAICDQPTVINLTQHSYFNLSGLKNSNVLDHQVQIFSDDYLPMAADSIATGTNQSVDNSPFNFKRPTALASVIGTKNQQLTLGHGYDHYFYGANHREDLILATVTDPVSGRYLTVASDQPGLQFYSGNYLGSADDNFVQYGGLCLETQQPAHLINTADPSAIILRPNQQYRSQTQWCFGC